MRRGTGQFFGGDRGDVRWGNHDQRLIPIVGGYNALALNEGYENVQVIIKISGPQDGQVYAGQGPEDIFSMVGADDQACSPVQIGAVCAEHDNSFDAGFLDGLPIIVGDP